MTKTVEVTVGWTNSDMENGYSSFCDGYRPGAEQHTETFSLEVPEGATPEVVAEAVFLGTNSPYVAVEAEQGVDTLAVRVHKAVQATGYDGRGFHYSLSVGDTVTVGGVMLACESGGWKVVEEVEV